MYCFNSDYTEGCHPAILEKLVATNMEQTTGYGMDAYCDEARELIKKACNRPDADVHLLVGGTQTNLVVISSALRPHQAVLASFPSHINTHEAGAIEHGGHRVIPLPTDDGKLTAEQIEKEWIKYTGQSLRLSIEKVGNIQNSSSLFYAALDGLLRRLVELQTECHVLKYGHVRIQSVVLEHHRDLSVLRSYIVNERIADKKLTLGDLLQTCDHTQRGGLTTTGRSYENKKLLILDLKAEVERERLQQEMNLAYQVYSQIATQLEASRIQAEQAKPVFAIINPVAVPLRKAAPSKVKLLILFTFLAGCISSAWVLWGDDYWQMLKKTLL